MGVMDFAREAGSKVGIGDSAEEKAEAASMEAAKEAAAKAKARNAAVKKRKDAAAASDAAKAKAAEEEKEEEKKARAADTARSESTERYLKTMGLGDVDVRVKDSKATIFGGAKDQATAERIVLAVGNIKGIDQVRDFLKVDAPAPESDVYVVQAGDSLSKIAKEVYGDAMRYTEIFEANKPMLTDPDLIFPGQTLRIPAA